MRPTVNPTARSPQPLRALSGGRPIELMQCVRAVSNMAHHTSERHGECREGHSDGEGFAYCTVLLLTAEVAALVAMVMRRSELTGRLQLLVMMTVMMKIRRSQEKPEHWGRPPAPVESQNVCAAVPHPAFVLGRRG